MLNTYTWQCAGLNWNACCVNQFSWAYNVWLGVTLFITLVVKPMWSGFHQILPSKSLFCLACICTSFLGTDCFFYLPLSHHKGSQSMMWSILSLRRGTLFLSPRDAYLNKDIIKQIILPILPSDQLVACFCQQNLEALGPEAELVQRPWHDGKCKAGQTKASGSNPVWRYNFAPGRVSLGLGPVTAGHNFKEYVNIQFYCNFGLFAILNNNNSISV